MKIKIVYANTKTYGGVKAYAMNLYSDMQKSLNVKLCPIPRFEISLHGKKLGGWTTQRLLSWTVGSADIVHSTSYANLVPHTNVVTIHDLYPFLNLIPGDTKRKKYDSKNLTKANSMKMVVAQSPIIEEQIRQFIHDVPITVIPSKIFVDKPTKNPYPEDNKIHLLTMGNIQLENDRKQIYDLYEWVKRLNNVDLYHIGFVFNKNYINYSKNIHLLGQVDQQTKFNYLAYADKYVLKTIGEGQGYPTMEAMRLNTQTIVNDLPEHRFFLGDKPYYFHNKEEFVDMIYKPKKSGLVEQITQYDNWILKYKKMYEEILK